LLGGLHEVGSSVPRSIAGYTKTGRNPLGLSAIKALASWTPNYRWAA